MTVLSRLLGATTFRALVVYLVVFAASAGGVIAYQSWRTHQLLTSQVVETIRTEVRGLNEQYDNGGLARLTDAVAERSQTSENGLYLLVGRAGEKLAGNLNRMPRDLAAEEGAGGVFEYRRTEAPRAGARLAVGVPVPVASGETLLVGRDVELHRAFIETSRAILLGGLALLAALAVGGGWFVRRHILNRIDEISAASRRIMAGDLTERIALGGSNDELDRLAVQLNEMLGRIETLVTGMREVSDNIAHDLRTPLNRLRNGLETALADTREEHARKQVLERALAEADALIATFNALLSIARLEAGTSQSAMEPVELDHVVRDVIELYEPLAEDEGMTIEARLAPGAEIRGNRQLIGQALANLMDNAIKYGRPEADAPGAIASEAGGIRIEVELTARESDVLVRVADDGAGISPGDRERVLGRFVRLERSRSQPGSGLGLSLVAAVAHLHGGTLRLEDNDPGLSAVLVLPRRTAQTRPERARDRSRGAHPTATTQAEPEPGRNDFPHSLHRADSTGS